jgi:hypothetical protein
MSANPKLTITAELPQELLKEFLQHLRDFDTEHDDCVFRIIAATEMTIDELERMFDQIDPRQTIRKN